MCPGLRGSAGHETLSAKPGTVLGQSEMVGHPYVCVSVNVYTSTCMRVCVFTYKFGSLIVSLLHKIKGRQTRFAFGKTRLCYFMNT